MTARMHKSIGHLLQHAMDNLQLSCGVAARKSWSETVFGKIALSPVSETQELGDGDAGARAKSKCYLSLGERHLTRVVSKSEKIGVQKGSPRSKRSPQIR